jgi:SanA protein
MNAVGYAAKDVDAYYGFKTKIREKLARIKFFLNLWSKSEPTFGGNRIKIPKK